MAEEYTQIELANNDLPLVKKMLINNVRYTCTRDPDPEPSVAAESASASPSPSPSRQSNPSAAYSSPFSQANSDSAGNLSEESVALAAPRALESVINSVLNNPHSDTQDILNIFTVDENSSNDQQNTASTQDILNIITVGQFHSGEERGEEEEEPKTPAPSLSTQTPFKSRVFSPEEYLKKFESAQCADQEQSTSNRPPSRVSRLASERPATAPESLPPTPAPSAAKSVKPVWILTKVTKYITTETRTETTCEC